MEPIHRNINQLGEFEVTVQQDSLPILERTFNVQVTNEEKPKPISMVLVGYNLRSSTWGRRVISTWVAYSSTPTSTIKTS
jgi:hypothetical protein